MSDKTNLPERTKPPLFDYAYLGNFPEVLENLKGKAMTECWEYKKASNSRPFPILFNYLHHTFSRIKEQNKIISNGKYSCFNTNLVTRNQEEIFMLFKENGDGGRFFIEFCKESDSNMYRFPKLPERANYFEDPTELIFDHRVELRINIDHIIDDASNFSRFPEDIKKLDKHQLLNTFQGALIHAKKRVVRNYKTAIPQYYRGSHNPVGQLQLLLPLCLKSTAKADLALAIYKYEGTYVGKTCLTLDMAINNARLISKPDDEWLKA